MGPKKKREEVLEKQDRVEFGPDEKKRNQTGDTGETEAGG